MSNYSFTPHVIPVFIAAFAALVLGLILVIRRRDDAASIHFFALCVAIFAWLACTAMGFLSQTPDRALRWFQFDNAGVMFISPSFFAFSAALVGLKKRKVWMLLAYGIATLFSALSVRGGFPATSVTHYWWGYFPRWTVVNGSIFFIFFFGWMGAAFLVLRSALRRGADGRLRTQIRYVLFAFSIAYLGSVDYLPTFGHGVYPFGYIPIMGLVSIIFYATLKHRLMNIDLVLRDTTVHLIIAISICAIAFVCAFPVVSFSFYLAVLVGIVATMTLMMFAYDPLRRLLQPAVDRLIFANRFGYLEELSQLPNDMLEFSNLREMLRFLVTRLKDSARLEGVSILMYDPAHQSYVETMTNMERNEVNTPLPQHGSSAIYLAELLSGNSKLWTDEDLSRLPAEKRRPVIKELAALGGAACFPVKKQEELIGIVVLGPKRSKEAFNQHDLQILRALQIRLENFLTQAMTITQEALNMVKDSHDMKNDVNALKGRVTWRAMQEAGWWGSFEKDFRSLSLLIAQDTLNAEERNIIRLALEDLRKQSQAWHEEVKKSTPIEDDALKRLAHRLRNWGEYGRVVSEGFKGQREMERVDVVRATRLSVERWRPMAERKNVRISESSTGEFFINGERSLLEQIVENLIDNALKATSAGSVEVVSRLEKDTVIVEVRDTGCGIPAEDLPTIFNKPFYQGRGREELEQSTGVGLYLVAQYAKSLGGHVSAESEVGKGSIFRLTLPAHEHDRQSAGAAA